MDIPYVKLVYGLHWLLALCFLHTSAAPPLKIVVQINKDNGHTFAMMLDSTCDSNPIECIESFVTQKLQPSSSTAAFLIQHVSVLHARYGVSCTSVFFHYVCKVIPFLKIQKQRSKSKTTNAFESRVMIKFRDNSKLTNSCYRAYMKKAEERIDRSALRDAEYYIDLLYSRTTGMQKHAEIRKLENKVIRMKQLDEEFFNATSRQLRRNEFIRTKWEPLDIVKHLIRYAKSNIYMNKVQEAREIATLILRVWRQGNFVGNLSCKKPPCSKEILYHFIGLLSSLGMPRQLLLLEKQMKLFSLDRFNLKTICDYYINYDRMINFKKEKGNKKYIIKARHYFDMIFKFSTDNTLLKWLVGPLSLPYGRKLKRRDYNIENILMPDKVAEFIRNEVETGSRIDKIKFGLLNLQKNNVDRVENTAFSSLKKKITNEYLKLGKPVIIENLESTEPFLKSIRSAWQTQNLRQNYGDLQVKIASSSDIANIQVFLTSSTCEDEDQNSKKMNISEYLDLIHAFNEHGNVSSDNYNPPYLLRSVSNPSRLTENYQTPKIFQMKERWDKVERERKEIALFSIGPRYSYTSFHMHSDAFNFLVSGAKKWFLCPPSVLCSGNTDTNMFEWYKNIKDKEINFSNIIEFVQLPGEMVYIPGGWSHAVINIGDVSIALAVELGWNMQFPRQYDEVVE